MADPLPFDPSNPYVVEAISRGVSEGWIADFIRQNPGDYHRILASASFDGQDRSGTDYGLSNLKLGQLAPQYRNDVRPGTETLIQPPGGLTTPAPTPAPTSVTTTAPPGAATKPPTVVQAGIFSGPLPLLALVGGAVYYFYFRK